MRAFVVDDEPLAVRRLTGALNAIEGVEVVGSATSGRRAIAMVEQARPDLLLLDIAMPGLDGFDIAEALQGETSPMIVFVTAYDHFAVRAFDIRAVDYLLKPVAPERLADAVTRARRLMETGGGDRQREAVREVVAAIRNEKRAPAPAPFVESFWAYRHREYVRVPVGDIQWVGAERDYVRLHTQAGGAGLLRETLTNVEAMLDPQAFIRVHRSVVVRRGGIVAVRRKRSGALLLTLASGAELPVGRSYAPGLKALLASMRGASRPRSDGAAGED